MKKRILIVDDDPNAMRILKKTLECHGDYEVREELQATRALAVAEEFRPDLLFLDVCMPDLDGGEVAFRFRGHRQFRRLPIIFFTSLVSERDTATAPLVTDGGFRFLPKTVDLVTLLACVEETLKANAHVPCS